MTYSTAGIILGAIGCIIFLLIYFVASMKTLFGSRVGEVIIPTVNKHTRKEYPYSLEEFIGQPNVIKNLEITLTVTKRQDKVLPHTLFYGPPGLGKTTLAEIIAAEMEVNFISVEGISLDSKDSILRVVNGIQEGTIVFIDEIHRMSNQMSEIWYKVMENYTIDIIDKDSVSKIDIPKFCTVGATTDLGMLLKPFRDRFQHLFELEPYSNEELIKIIKVLDPNIENDVAELLANVSQKTPRIAKAYLKAMKEYAVYYRDGNIKVDDFETLKNLKQINSKGLTNAQRRVLKVLSTSDVIGKDALATAINASKYDLEEMIEPFLITEGYIVRTSRGRKITEDGIRALFAS